MESKHRQHKQRQMRRKDRYHEKSKRGPTKHWEATGLNGRLWRSYQDRSLTTRQSGVHDAAGSYGYGAADLEMGANILAIIGRARVTAITTAWVYRIDGWLRCQVC